jgi:hypothetical protein
MAASDVLQETLIKKSEQYIFISYAHKDSDRVLPIIKRLSALGFNVWYDEGIKAGTEWPDYIAKRLEDATCVIAFLSPAAVASFNCRQEINYAIDLGKPTMTVYLDEFELTGGMRMRLGLSQAMFYYRHANLDSFIDELSLSEMLTPCLNKIPQDDSAKVTPQAQQKTQTSLHNNDGDFLIQNNVLLEYKGSGGEVIIPDGITVIGHSAFSSASVTKVFIPDSVREIGQAAFQSCTELTSVNIPGSVATLGNAIFLGCTKLSDITLGEGLTLIANNMFSLCHKLKSIVIPQSVKIIDQFAFAFCDSLESVTLSHGLETILDNSFSDCINLQTIAIPETVTEIGACAFEECRKLQKAYVYKKTKYKKFFGRTFPKDTWVIKN